MKKCDDIKARVAEALEVIGDTNDGYAEKLGVNKNTVTAYRARRGDVRGRALCGLALHYDIEPNWLLLGIGGMFRSETESDRSVDADIEAERAKLHIAAKRAELEYLKRLSPNDDPDESMKQLEFISEMVKRLRAFQESLTGKETEH